MPKRKSGKGEEERREAKGGDSAVCLCVWESVSKSSALNGLLLFGFFWHVCTRPPTVICLISEYINCAFKLTLASGIIPSEQSPEKHVVGHHFCKPLIPFVCVKGYLSY